MQTNKSLLMLGLGAGIGAAAAILLAPKTGPQMRKLIRCKADESSEYVKRRTGEMFDTASDVIEKSKRTVQQYQDTFGAALEAGRSAYQRAIRH